MSKKKDTKKTWKDVTLRQAIELEKLGEMVKLDLIIHQYAILNKMKTEDVEKMTPEELLNKSREYEFILRMPEPKRTDYVKVNGRRYGLCEFSKLTLGQMVDIEEYYNDGLVENSHKILSVLMLPVKRKFPFMKPVLEEYEPSEQRENDILDLDMDVVWGNLLFFYLIEMKYIKGILDYSQAQAQTLSQRDQDILNNLIKAREKQ